MSQNKDDEIPGTSPASIKMDLVRFKDDILKDIRSIQFSLDDKYFKADDFIKQRITQFELQLKTFNQKISDLSNLIVTDNSIREKVESLNQFKEEMKDTIFKRRAMFNELETKVDNNINRVNYILTESVIYPALIGKKSKFKNFHEFMDFVVQEIVQLNLFKEKNILDLTPYKKKIDQAIDTFQILMKKYSSKDYIANTINLIEEKNKNLLKIYEERLEENRIENSHYAFNLQKKSEEIWKQMENLQKNLNKKLENQKNSDVGNSNNEIIYIKNRINKINEVIRELLSYHPKAKKNFGHDFEKKSSKIYSGVKQYIKGNINAEELSSMKKFTNEKSKTKVFDKPSPSQSISPFPSPEILTNNNLQKRNSYILNNADYFFLNHQLSRDNTSINRKNFFTQKNLNDKSREDYFLGKKYSNQEINQKINDNIFFKRTTSLRKKTFNGKINEDILRNQKRQRTLKLREKENINDEENKLDISSNTNNNENSSFSNNKEDNNKENNDLNNKNSLKIDNISRKESSKNNNLYILKEEDENIPSENSCKNIEICTKRKKNKKKDNNPKKDSKNEINIKEIKIEEDNKIDSINNDKGNNTINLNNSENDKKKLISIQKMINLNNSENKNILILSLKKKVNSPNSKNNNENLIVFTDNNTNKSINNNKKNEDINSSNLNNKTINQNPKVESQSLEMKNYQNIKTENLLENTIKNISPQEKQSKKLINNSLLPKKNIQKSTNSPNPNSLENNLKSKKMINQINYNFKPNNNLFSIHKVNKTYTKFPKIFKDLSENKIQNNNIIHSKDMDIFAKTLNSAKFTNQDSKVAAYMIKPKKILLTSPDNIPPNGIIIKNIKNKLKNNSFGFQGEKTKKF